MMIIPIFLENKINNLPATTLPTLPAPHGQPPLAKSSKTKKTTFWVAEPKPTTDMPDRHAGWWVPYRRS